MKKQTATQSIYKRFKQFIILGIVAILGTACGTTTTTPNFETTKQQTQQDNADAQYNLGLMYYNGQGVKMDYKKAFYWFKKSAEQGNAQAQILLGEIYQTGYGGTPQDEKKALYWFKKSAENGNPQGMAQYGTMLYNGSGGARLDKNKGLYYLKKSARMGNQDAQFYLNYVNIKY